MKSRQLDEKSHKQILKAKKAEEQFNAIAMVVRELKNNNYLTNTEEARHGQAR